MALDHGRQDAHRLVVLTGGEQRVGDRLLARIDIRIEIAPRRGVVLELADRVLAIGALRRERRDPPVELQEPRVIRAHLRQRARRVGVGVERVREQRGGLGGTALPLGDRRREPIERGRRRRLARAVDQGSRAIGLAVLHREAGDHRDRVAVAVREIGGASEHAIEIAGLRLRRGARERHHVREVAAGEHLRLPRGVGELPAGRAARALLERVHRHAVVRERIGGEVDVGEQGGVAIGGAVVVAARVGDARRLVARDVAPASDGERVPRAHDLRGAIAPVVRQVRGRDHAQLGRAIAHRGERVDGLIDLAELHERDRLAVLRQRAEQIAAGVRGEDAGLGRLAEAARRGEVLGDLLRAGRHRGERDALLVVAGADREAAAGERDVTGGDAAVIAQLLVHGPLGRLIAERRRRREQLALGVAPRIGAGGQALELLAPHRGRVERQIDRDEIGAVGAAGGAGVGDQRGLERHRERARAHLRRGRRAGGPRDRRRDRRPRESRRGGRRRRGPS